MGDTFPLDWLLVEGEPQVPPLRYAPVGMTKRRVAAYLNSRRGGMERAAEYSRGYRRPPSSTNRPTPCIVVRPTRLREFDTQSSCRIELPSQRIRIPEHRDP